jgi:hypothetical protein
MKEIGKWLSAVALGASLATAAPMLHQSGDYCKIADHWHYDHNKSGKLVRCVPYTAWHWKNV